MANACTDHIGAVRSVRLFKIDGFSLVTKTMGSEECTKSRCDVDGYEWEIQCYPAYHWCGTNRLGFKLILLSEPRTCNVTASLDTVLLHPIPRGGTLQERSASTHAIFKRRNDCANRTLLVEIRRLPVPASPEDDYLTVRCTITVLKNKKPLPDAATASVPVPVSDMHRHFGELLQSGMGADITFLVSGEEFPAHKLVLAARSPVFMAEFFGDMKETRSRRVEIEDVEAAAFRAMLHFVYTDSVPELDQELAAVVTMAQHLLAAADRYGLERLKLICEGKLAGGVTVDTAATTLALAEQHNCSHLKAKCVEFIVSTPAILDAVLATEGYKHLEASCPSVLTGLLKSMREMKN